MKQILSAVILMLFTAATTNANPFPSITTPALIIKKADMYFGKIPASSENHLATLGPDSKLVTDRKSNPKILYGNSSAACLAISGEPGYLFAITLPLSGVLTDGNDHSMTICKFVSNPSVSGTLGAEGNAEIHLGATVIFSENQPIGLYSNPGEIAVTIHYN